jgi:hypothetical protein
MLSMNVGVPKLLRGEIWWLMVEQHKLHYPAKDIQSPCRDYQDPNFNYSPNIGNLC